MKRFTLLIALVTLCSTSAVLASTMDVDAHASFWWTLYEQVENGLHQAGSEEEAVDVASGFNLQQGRLGFSFLSDDEKFAGVVRLRLEERPDILDFYGVWHLKPSLMLMIGQMKIPGSKELLTPGHKRDFIIKSVMAENLADYSLSRTPYISSIMSAKSWDRDLGLAVKGNLSGRRGSRFDYLLMLGNGLGAGKFIGGDSDEFLYTNRPGDWLYAGRLNLSVSRLALGLHGSFNRHKDVAVGNRGPVFDLDRRVIGGDVEVTLPRGLRLSGFYCRGWMDDFWTSTRYDYDFDGFGIQGMLSFADGWETGARFDSMGNEFHNDGYVTTDERFTWGLNYQPRPFLRLQLNYVRMNLEDEFIEDIADNALHLNVEFIFES
ncbi:MAG: hypothetical protein GY835_27435 [bacterium]|nr:hypothetical protein [bacterium]